MIHKASAANPDPEPPYILTLDVGTSSMRMLLIDALCNALPNILAQHPYQLTTSNEGEVAERCSTLGVPVYPSRDHESSAHGAALLVLEALSMLPDVAQVPPHLKSSIQPDVARHAMYKKGATRQ